MAKMDDGPVSLSDELWAARRLIAQHQPADGVDRAIGCTGCDADGCAKLDEARALVARYVPRQAERR